jgi:Leucine-rich repeat (LRR) protein
MNIILEQRADVIQNNNTAQERLKSILENLNKTAQRIRIIEPLYGDIDFSILAEYGFSTIKDITLSKGEITSITGLPKILMSLSCVDNLLTELIDLPRGLRNIDIAHNYLTQIDISPIEQLETLVVTDNKITTLENLPSTLAMIRCDNNQLTHLNLAGLTQLELLNVSNNPITVIENMPENIVDFKMENTPSIEFRNSPVIPIIDKSVVV